VSDSAERFPEKNRLSKPSDFQEVFKTAKRYANKNFLVLVRNNSGDMARLGLAISARRIQTAVKRNMIKRLIRESFRRNKNRLKGMDIVVIAQNGAAGGDTDSISTSLSDIWGRIAK